MTLERAAWIALAAVDGVGPVTFERLVSRYGSATAVLDAAADGLPGSRFAADGVRVVPRVAQGIGSAARDRGAIGERLRAVGGWAITPLDAGWPRPLDRIADPPPVLFGRGDPASLRPMAIAVVGTRHPSAIGIHAAERIAAVASRARIAVVSGLALGVDVAAHAAAIAHGGVTVGVSGGGLAAGWPRRNDRVAEAILTRGGTIVTELAPGSAATVGTFPRRNRIIAGLAAVTIVVEAPAGSGSLITARHALAQGRPVAVVSGPAGSPSWAGGLALAGETPAEAHPLEELVAAFAAASRSCLPGPLPSPAADRAAPVAGAIVAGGPVGAAEADVAALLGRGPTTADGAGARLGLGPGVAAAALLMLQLRGWARPWGGVWLPAGPLLAATAPVADAVVGMDATDPHRPSPGTVACTGDP